MATLSFLACALAFQSGAAPRYDTAFVAKYYGTSAQDGFYQVYLSDHQGKSRVCLTNNAKNYGSVRWINNNELAIIEQGLRSDALIVFNLKTGESALIREFAKSESPVLLVHPYVGINVCLLRTGNSPYRYFSVENKSVRPIPNPPVSAFRCVTGEMNFYANGEPVALKQSAGIQPSTVVWTFTTEAGSAQVVSGRTLGYFEAFRPRAKNQLWVNIWSGNDRIGYSSDLYELDLSKGVAKPLIMNVHNLSFHFDSRYWTALSPYYQYQALADGKRVRVNAGLVGDRTTGARWTIASGLVHVKSISLLPGM